MDESFLKVSFNSESCSLAFLIHFFFYKLNLGINFSIIVLAKILLRNRTNRMCEHRYV